MKILSIEVSTDLGRRTIQLSPPMAVEPREDMPSTFRALTELLWKALCQVDVHGHEMAAGQKVEA